MSSPQNLTRIAARGSAWLYSSSVLMMLASVFAQVALGWLLSEADFGVYALAIATANFFQVFRDGGVSLWLSRRPQEDFAKYAGPAFWLSLSAATGIAVCLAVAAPGVARLYAEPQVASLMLLFALALPLDAFGVVAEAHLEVTLRFRVLGQLRVLSAIIRYAMIIALAVSGWGPLSFALPVIPLQLFRAVWLYYLTRLQPWRSPPSFRAGARILAESGWAMGGAVASALFRQIDYLVLGVVATTNVVGIYFFAYQLAFQPVLVFSQSVSRVVVPTFARVTNEPERQSRAVRGGAVFIGVVASFLILGLGLLMPGIEQVLWRGRWAAAVLPMQLLLLAMPIHLFSLFTRMVIQSTGDFRLWTIAVGWRGIGLGVVVAGAARLLGEPTATPISAAVAVYLIVSGIAEAYWLLRSVRIAAGGILLGAVLPYTYLAVAAVATQITSACLPDHSMLVRMAAMSLVFTLAGGGGMWLLFRPQLRELRTIGEKMLKD